MVLIVSPGARFEPSSVIIPSIELLEKGGLLLCDNYHQTARYVSDHMGKEFDKVNIENSGEFSVFRKKI